MCLKLDDKNCDDNTAKEKGWRAKKIKINTKTTDFAVTSENKNAAERLRTYMRKSKSTHACIP